MKYKKILLTVFIISMIPFISSCHKNNKEKQKIITVEHSPITKTLYFSGEIQPISKTPIVTPIEGVISEIFFKYGHEIKKDQLLCTINSSKQEANYENTLTEFIKTKQKFLTTQNKLKSTKDLFKKGIISRNEYEENLSEYNSDRLSFLQSQTKLDEMLKQYQIEHIGELSITDIESVKKALAIGKKSDQIKIKATKDGIASFIKEKNEAGKKLEEGDVLLYLGDMSGISTEIEVNEMVINQLKEGQEAHITTSVDPNISLVGFIKNISLQAKSGESLPSFSVKIIVPKLTEEQQKIIHIGMSAKIAISLQHPKKLVIPINAVFQENTDSFVKVIVSKTKKIKKVRVTTGDTTEDSVTITSGLKAGDQIVISN